MKRIVMTILDGGVTLMFIAAAIHFAPMAWAEFLTPYDWEFWAFSGCCSSAVERATATILRWSTPPVGYLRESWK
jgi:hypothetical protein